MSNKLSIELTTFKQRNSEQIVYGFIAEDQYHSFYHREFVGSWEEFKDRFPSKESLFDKAIESDGFSEFSTYVRFENDEAIIEDEDAPLSAVYFEGCEDLYA